MLGSVRAVPSLRAIAAAVGVPYSTAYITLERLLGLRARHIARIDNSDLGVINGHVVEAAVKAAVLLARRRLAYYTMPPIPLWPWILVPAKSIDTLEKLLESMRELGARPAEVILDIGVMDWFDKKVMEYSEGFWRAFWEAVDRLRELSQRYGFSWRVVTPDVPATVPDNISRTMRLQERLLAEHPELPWLPVAQASRGTGHSKHLAWLVETGIAGKYGVVALGSLKVLAGRQKRVWIQAVGEARRLLEDYGLGHVRLHLFGAPLDAAVSSRLPPGSWDSKTWTFPRVPYMWSAKGATERLTFFTAFLERLTELLRGGGDVGVAVWDDPLFCRLLALALACGGWRSFTVQRLARLLGVSRVVAGRLAACMAACGAARRWNRRTYILELSCMEGWEAEATRLLMRYGGHRLLLAMLKAILTSEQQAILSKALEAGR
jgi:hypothetical protein